MYGILCELFMPFKIRNFETKKKVGNSAGMCRFRNKAALLLHVNAAEVGQL